jgi:DNA replication factor GINS
MNLDELRSAQAKERRKDSLQHLRDSFYDDVAAYVADLRAARDRRAEQVDKPFSDDDVRRLSDEVETAEEVAEALYERRVGKVVKLASFAAAEMSVDADGMTTEERRLFDDLVERIKRNKSNVLDVLSGEAPVSGSDASAAAADPNEDPAPPASEPGVADEAALDEAAPDGAAPDETAPDGATLDETGGEGVADALAGAMGGADDGVADALDATPDGAADRSDSSPPADGPGAETDVGAEGGVTTDGGPTAVPPEPAPPGAPGVDDADAEPAGEPTTGSGPDGDASDSEADAGMGDRATVRITRDVGAIFGVDEREYDLASEDVVSLPVENAEPLVQRNAAERLD